MVCETPNVPSPHAPRCAPLDSRTIVQVAARARVSIATVSRVFADAERVSHDLRERVQMAARSSGYQPSRVARSLRVGTSLTIGVVIPDVQNPFFTGIVRGIERVLLEAGYMLLLGNSDETPEREARMLATLRAEGVAGIVFVPIASKTHHDRLETVHFHRGGRPSASGVAN